jgi:hypothetical protein
MLVSRGLTLVLVLVFVAAAFCVRLAPPWLGGAAFA